MNLRILYACTECRRIVVGEFYDLRQMFGKRVVCEECAKNLK